MLHKVPRDISLLQLLVFLSSAFGMWSLNSHLCYIAKKKVHIPYVCLTSNLKSALLENIEVKFTIMEPASPGSMKNKAVNVSGEDRGHQAPDKGTPFLAYILFSRIKG